MVRGPLLALHAALAQSFMAGVPEQLLDDILDDAELVHVSPGAMCAREGEDRQLAILISGMARAFVSSEHGRQLDVRVLHPGDAMGLSALAGQRNVVGIQAVTPCDILHLDAALVRRRATESQPLAWAIATELSRRADDLILEYRVRAFGSVRQRLARFLLERSAPVQNGTLVFRSSRQDIADAIGTGRRVVLRELTRMCDSGLIARGGGHLVILDPIGLQAVAVGDDRSRRQPARALPIERETLIKLASGATR